MAVISGCKCPTRCTSTVIRTRRTCSQHHVATMEANGMHQPSSSQHHGPSSSSSALHPNSGRSGRSTRIHASANSMGDDVLTSQLIAKATNKSIDELSSIGRSTSKVAYQGVPGAYSEMAALNACPGYEPLPCEQFEVAFQAVSQWLVERAVLPIENSLGGSIHTVYDLLVRYRLHIVGETSVAVNHCLMALPGTRKEDLTRVMSHPQALAQCDGYTRALNVVKEAVDDTAGAARMVAAQKMQGVAAIASRRAAELYGLDILDEGIQDMKENVTRFIVLSRDPPVLTSDSDPRTFKTSIVFSLNAGPGELFKALSVFALRDIDMTKIESRPLRTDPIILASSGSTAGRRFNFVFYVDFIGTMSSPKCQNALRHLQEIAPFMRVLGSYPMDTELGELSSDVPFSTLSSVDTI